MSLELSLKNKFIVLFSLAMFLVTTTAKADPVVAGEILPPASATLVMDPDLIKLIGVGPEDDPVWCYSNDANAILITAAERERERCQLNLQQELLRAKTDCDFIQEQLNLSIESLNNKYKTMESLKDRQIEELTQAALKRPNDYSFWWATGGVTVGVLTTLAIMFAVK